MISKQYNGGETLLSEEGATQGDPLAIPMYALEVVPLINTLSDDFVKQVWYADDATTCGSLSDIHCWWNELDSTGPTYGYSLLIMMLPSRSFMVQVSYHCRGKASFRDCFTYSLFCFFFC